MAMNGLRVLLIEMKVTAALTAPVIVFGEDSTILPQLIPTLSLSGLIRIKVSPLKQLHIRTAPTSGGTAANVEMNIRLSYILEPKDAYALFV